MHRAVVSIGALAFALFVAWCAFYDLGVLLVGFAVLIRAVPALDAWNCWLSRERLANEVPRALLEDQARAADDGVAMLGACPRCRARLGDAGGPFDERACASGHGVLVPPSSTDALLARAGVAPGVLKALVCEHSVRARAPCAACGATMRTVTLKGVDVDACAGCGALWLGQAQLRRLSREELFGDAPGVHGRHAHVPR